MNQPIPSRSTALRLLLSVWLPCLILQFALQCDAMAQRQNSATTGQKSQSRNAPLARPKRRRAMVARGTAGVACQTQLAADIGRDVLARGGNAVDAAVAVAIALNVTWPEAGNIGGGGYMLVATSGNARGDSPTDNRVQCIDYREVAPMAARRDSFVGWKDRRHEKMVGVPGTLRGLADAHRRYGTIAWADLIAPSIQIARDGFVVDDALAYSLNRALNLGSIRSNPRYAEFRRVYANPETYLWRAGQTLRQPDLASTLQSISREVDAGFYDGNLAKRIASTIESGGGLMRVDDLKNYRTIRRDAIHAQANGYDVYGPPPSSSGGITVLMQLKMLEQLRITKPSAAPWTIDQVHLLTETMRRAFRDRAAYLGDPDFAELPGDLLSEKRVRSHVDTIDRNRATRSDALLGDMKQTYLPAHESPQTTHFSIVDAAGMMVSNTYTLEARFGSHIVVPGTGILLNNEMGDFNWQPGVTNDLGAIGTQPNTIAGGKRMLSSQSPTIVKRNGRAILAVGSPGGRTIINTVTQVLVQRIFFGRSLEDAVNAPRFHHQWLPDSLVMERDSEGLMPSFASDLRSRGHQVRYLTPESGQGLVHAIEITPTSSQVTVVADGRLGGGVSVLTGTAD